MNKNELKSELARKYYSEDQNCLSDFIDILDEYEKLTLHNSDYAKLPSYKDIINHLTNDKECPKFLNPDACVFVDKFYKAIVELGNFA